jgi:cytochrome d ubiquinol oxidase subunit I
VFTPTFIPRLLHVWAASWTVGAALMCSVSAWYLLKKQHIELAKSNLKGRASRVHPVRDPQRLRVRGEHGDRGDEQPALKLASMEGLYQSESCARMFVVGWVDTATQTTSGISIPCLLSFLAYQDIHATVQGIDSFAPDPTPPINLCSRSITS